MKEIILASSSPRRKELMGLIPTRFKIITKEVEETINVACSPKENVQNLADKKAYAVACDHKDEWVLGCDTVVVCEEEILGKPQNVEHAKEMLKRLSGQAHLVYTGVSLRNIARNVKITQAVCSKVYMKEISEEELKWYVATGEPLDKAGAYGIQGLASNFMEKIEGDYFNIVGLPVSTVYEILKQQQLINL
ncbi:MAG: Maf family protein [Niameybacter sp.]|uniref:Maf family protein n=1 Tax=Niameybacter sp. TaxID=2033640 RepID=UPI002FC676D5